MTLRLYLAIVLLALGCSDSAGQPTAPIDPDASAPPLLADAAGTIDAGAPPLLADAADTKAAATSILGTWTGYVENFEFMSGSDVIRFTLTSDANGALVGSVVLGNGLAPPPASDASRGYPPDVSSTNYDPPSWYWHEGFAYSMVRGTVAAARMKFTIENVELWAGWCALQTSPDGGGMCLPRWGGTITPDDHCSQTNPATGQVIAVDCGKFNLCSGLAVCLCFDTPCAVKPEMGTTLAFDLTFSGSTASGSVVGGRIDRANVHFVHDQQ